MLNYKKKFIILKNKYSNIKGYKPKGHMKLEIKGPYTNIDVNIENAEADSSYSLTLITEEIIELGKIYTDSYGRTKSELSLRTDDFLQGELEHGAVLLHRGKDVLLGEYMDKDDGKIEEFIEGLKDDAVELEAEPQLEPELEPEPEYEEKEIQPFEEDLQVEREFYEEVIDPEEQQQEQPQEEEVWTKEGDYEFQEQFEKDSQEDNEEEVVPEGFEQEEQKEYVDLEYEYNLKKTEQTTSYVLSVLRYFPYAEPFEQELQDHNWWRIDYNEEVEEGFLPYFNYIADTNAVESMKKYKHYIFGLYNQGDEVKFYIYGVPGSFTIEEHPNAGESGFKTWFKGVEEEGYWLLYIDPMTGRVIEPLDPMNPS